MKAEDFLGRWAFDREVTGRDGGHMRGVAEFSPGAPIVYHETGTLTLHSGADFTFERRYLWTFDEAGADVAFADGRAFHRVEFSAAQARHWCDPDTYEVTYDFTRWPRWTAIWNVSGPRKSYVSTTRYRKQGD